jgi:PAS domain S-box-containing protein
MAAKGTGISSRKPSFSLVLFSALLLLILIVVGTAVAVNYATSIDSQKRQHLSSIRQAESNIVTSVTLIDTGRKELEETYHPGMRGVLDSAVVAYEESGRDPRRIDLNALVAGSGLDVDINFVNSSGVVEYSTSPDSVGLDFSLAYPYYSLYLQKIRQTDGYYPDRAVAEYFSGEVMEFADMPTPDHQYVIELILRDPGLLEVRESLSYEEGIQSVVASHPVIQDVHLYTSDRREMIGNTSYPISKSTRELVDRVYTEKKPVDVPNADGKNFSRYLYIPLSDPRYAADMDIVAEVTYDNSRLSRHLDSILFSNLVAGIALFIIGGLVMIPLTYFLTSPVRVIAEDVDVISKGDLDHRVRTTPVREFVILGEGIDSMVGTLKETIRDLRKREEQYKEVVENQTDLICRWTPDGTCIFANEAYCRYFGRSCQEIIGKRFSPGVYEADEYKVQNHVKSLLPENPVHELEYRVVLPDGSVRWHHRYDHGFFGEDGSLVEIQAVSRDITDRIRTLEDLLASERRFRSLIEVSPVSIVLMRDQKIIYGNPAARKLFGVEPEEVVIGRLFTDFIAPSEREVLSLQYEKRLRGEQAPVEFETTGVRKDGTLFPCQAAISRLTLADGPATIAFLNDITARKKAEAEINRLCAGMEDRVRERTAELLRANRELEAFSYTISHDLRAPLRAIDGFSGIIVQQYGRELPADVVKYLSKVRENTGRMAGLLDAILELSRIGRQEIRKEEVQVNPIVDAVIEDLRPDMEGRMVELEIGLLPDTLADPVMIRQVYFNLLNNALKFTREKSPARIDIGSMDKEKKTVYFVRDNGVGFDMQYADKLFKIFSRLHDQSSYEGTGVGLAIVHRIIERHGGTIWAESAVNQGTTFYFTLE